MKHRPLGDLRLLRVVESIWTTEDAVNHTLVFSTPSSGNEVIIHTADGLNHDLTNVTNVLWHA